MKPELNKTKKGIIKALCYSDIFDYPLKRSEIGKYFIGSKSSIEKIRSELINMRENGEIGFSRGFYFLSGKRKLVNIRAKRKSESEVKLQTARTTIRILSFIPTVRLVGISGSLSMKNAKKEDDIDLFIVTSENSLWATRFIVNLVLIFFGRKRNKYDTLGIDKFCPNMFLEDSCLSLQVPDRNIFSAHEIAQLKPIINKGSTYEKFINQNMWVSDFLPNALCKADVGPSEKPVVNSSFLNKIFFLAQFYYMKGKLTRERVTENSARFHPKDKTSYVNLIYRAKYKNYINFLKSAVKNPASDKFQLSFN